MKKFVIGFSGGLDSTTLLALLLDQGHEVHCCTFYYGSKHGKHENKAAFAIIEYYQNLNKPVFHYFFNLAEAFTGFDSSMLNAGQEIPEGHYEAENMKSTVVPGRNLIFASIMAGLAESIKAEAICLGVHAGDHFIYPDCRPEFVDALTNCILASSDGKVTVYTPLVYITKAEIIKVGTELPTPAPYHLTRTCYKDQENACGVCGSCNERLEAFKLNNIKDPVKYE